MLHLDETQVEFDRLRTLLCQTKSCLLQINLIKKASAFSYTFSIKPTPSVLLTLKAHPMIFSVIQFNLPQIIEFIRPIYFFIIFFLSSPSVLVCVYPWLNRLSTILFPQRGIKFIRPPYFFINLLAIPLHLCWSVFICG